MKDKTKCPICNRVIKDYPHTICAKCRENVDIKKVCDIILQSVDGIVQSVLDKEN
jgi:rRNA maturation endonuclease Nob1